MALVWCRWRGREGRGQDSEHILPFGLPILFACPGVKHLAVSSAKFLLQGCSWSPSSSLRRAWRLPGWAEPMSDRPGRKRWVMQGL